MYIDDTIAAIATPPRPVSAAPSHAHAERAQAKLRAGHCGCTTVMVAGVDLPTPRSIGWYMSSTSGGGTV